MKTDAPITLEGGETSLRMLQQQCAIVNITSTNYYSIKMDNYGKLPEEGGKASVYSEGNYLGKGDILKAETNNLAVKFNFNLTSPNKRGFNMTFKVSKPRNDLSLYYVTRVKDSKQLIWPSEYIEILGLYKKKDNNYKFACYKGDFSSQNEVKTYDFTLSKVDKSIARRLEESGDNDNKGDEDLVTTKPTATEGPTTPKPTATEIPTTPEPTLPSCGLIDKPKNKYIFEYALKEKEDEKPEENMTCHMIYSLSNSSISSIDEFDVKDWLFKKDNKWYYGTESSDETTTTPPTAVIEYTDENVKKEMLKEPQYVYIPSEISKTTISSSIYIGAKITVTVTGLSVSRQEVTVVSIEEEVELEKTTDRRRVLTSETKYLRIKTDPAIEYDGDLTQLIVQVKDDGIVDHTEKECSNQGLCNRVTGECECYNGFEGIACQRIACPNDCNGNGRCVSVSQALGIDAVGDNQQYGHDQLFACKCDPGRRGPDCSLLECPSGVDPLGGSNTLDKSMKPDINSQHRDCSGRGTCDYSTGLCKCYSGYSGEGCQTTVSIN